MKEVFAVPRFLRFWLSQVLSQAGNAISTVIIAVAVIPEYGMKIFAFVLALETLCMSLSSIAGGVWADRYSRTLLMVCGDGARMMGLSFYMWAVSGERVPALVAGAVIIGLGAGVFEPAHRSSLPQIVPEHLLQKANSVDSATKRTASAAGAVLGGVMGAAGIIRGALLLDIISFAVSMVFLIRIALPAINGAVEHSTFIRDAMEGLKQLRQQPWIAVVVGQGAIQMLLTYGPIFALLPVISEQYGTGRYGLVSATQFLGTIAGSIVGGRFRTKRPGLVAMHALALSVLLTLALALHAPFAMLIITVFLAWAGISVFFILWYTGIGTNVDPVYQGRVFSLEVALSFAFQPLGILIAPYIVQRFGFSVVWFVAAGVMLVTTYAVLIVPRVATFGSVETLDETQSGDLY